MSSPAQVPRLSGMLRSLGPEGTALDAGALYLQRKQALEARRQERASQKARMPRAAPCACMPCRIGPRMRP